MKILFFEPIFLEYQISNNKRQIKFKRQKTKDKQKTNTKNQTFATHGIPSLRDDICKNLQY